MQEEMSSILLKEETKVVISKNQVVSLLWNEETDTNKTFEVEEGANLSLLLMNLKNTERKYNFCMNIYESANVHIYNVATTKKDFAIEEKINLCAPLAKCEIMSVLLVGGEARLNCLVEVNHKKESTQSLLENYAIARDFANVLLNNNGTIDKFARGSICHQKAKGLTLSPQAKIKAMPNLYINEFDVIANHACSIGSVNEDDLFYLMSRGLSKDTATELIVMGFIAPLLEQIKDSNIQKVIYNHFKQILAY